MKVLRRILAALVMAGVAAAGIRVRGKGGTPPQHGGWRPLDLPDQRR
jgi:alpha-beta hydrolase superfamily lysophospholipase